MIIKSLFLVVTLCLVGCAAPQYSIVSGQYGWDKRDTGGSQYSSDTMYKINTETGETWKMSFQKGKGFYWESINHLNLEKTEN